MANIDDVKLDNLRMLYVAAVSFRERHLELKDHLSPVTVSELDKAGVELEAILTRVNNGKSPCRPRLRLSAADVCATAAILAT